MESECEPKDKKTLYWKIFKIGFVKALWRRKSPNFPGKRS